MNDPTWFQRLLAWLRLTDENGQLSLTNCAVIVVIVKIALAKDVSLPDLGALLLSLSAYTGKKVLKAQAEAREDAAVTADHIQALDALKAGAEVLAQKLEKLETRSQAQDATKALAQAQRMSVR